MAFKAEDLSKDEKSILVYVECCAVDAGGLLEGQRMNAADHEALRKFKAAGLLDYGRVPARLLGTGARNWTHWCDLNAVGWSLASELRKLRAHVRGPFRVAVDAAVAERLAGEG